MSNFDSQSTANLVRTIFVLYFDPAELDARLEVPGYLRGAFATEEEAQLALRTIGADPTDVRWLIAEEPLDEFTQTWTEGFTSVSWTE